MLGDVFLQDARLKRGEFMSLNGVDWQRVTDEAVRITSCDFCTRQAVDSLPQPFWVGEAYQPGGIVLVARNPASKELPEPAKQRLERLRQERSPAAFATWSSWRISQMTSKPWTQWERAFKKAVDGIRTPQQLAWLNVVPFCTPGNKRPSAAVRTHGRAQHLAPLLAHVLRPSLVIARYSDAEAAVAAIPGPWQGSVLPLNGRSATPSDVTAARQALRDRGLLAEGHADETAALPPRPIPAPRSPQTQPTAMPQGGGLAAIRSALLAALTATSGFPAVETEQYTSIGDPPAWAFVDRRTASIPVKFRIAPPYTTAKAISARLAAAGVDARVREIRSRPGSTRLQVRLYRPDDLARLRSELAALWLDYQQLR
jgi:hypothetical protein